jgi:hypothetical protein
LEGLEGVGGSGCPEEALKERHGDVSEKRVERFKFQMLSILASGVGAVPVDLCCTWARVHTQSSPGQLTVTRKKARQESDVESVGFAVYRRLACLYTCSCTFESLTSKLSSSDS